MMALSLSRSSWKSGGVGLKDLVGVCWGEEYGVLLRESREVSLELNRRWSSSGTSLPARHRHNSDSYLMCRGES